MNKNILYLIMTSHRNQIKQDNISKTWAQNKNYIFYSDRENTNTIQVTYQDDYSSNEIKTIKLIQKFPEKYLTYDWFMFCDDDTFINTKLLENILNDFDQNKITGSLINSWLYDKTLFYLSGGAGFLMHKNILISLIDKIKLYHTGYNDVTIGLNCRNLNIQLQNSNLFNAHPPELYNIIDPQNYISFHYIKTFQQMKELTNQCQ